MRLLYLHNAEYTSNMANLIQVKAMCKAMSDAKMDVTLSLQGSNKNELPTGKYPYNIDIRKPLVNNKKIDKYINIQSVKNTIAKIDPDILFLRNPLLLKQAVKSKKPIIIELHNYKLHQGYNWLNKYWHGYLVKLSKTDRILKVVCISQALSDYWNKKGIPAEKIVTAHDGIDDQQFDTPADKMATRRKLKLPEKRKIITYVGRLYKNRKIENIIKLAETFPNALFMVVGGPESQSQYYKQIAEELKLTNIVFTGQVKHENVSDYLYASDILLALWSSEVGTINYCSPLKLFEYMAAERIIVAHGFPTIKEVVTHNQNAILVKPDSLEDLIVKTGEALKLPNESPMAEQARKLVLEKYTWQKRVEKIFDSL
jgi:glycosyltransferase involved in cell wall biosynthesis